MLAIFNSVYAYILHVPQVILQLVFGDINLFIADAKAEDGSLGSFFVEVPLHYHLFAVAVVSQPGPVALH